MIKAFVESYPVRSDRSVDGRTRVREWGWRITLAATGEAIAFDGGHATKRAAIEAGKGVATGYYHYDEAEVIQLTRSPA